MNEIPEDSPQRFASDEARWAAVLARDVAAVDAFIYAVRTTGIYCRPTCPSRRPRRENAEFYADAAAAEQAGYRPCQRCHPLAASLPQRHAQSVARACRLIQHADTLPSLDELAQVAGLSRFHFHRVFTAVTGLTPKAYAAACRSERVRQALTRQDTVTDAIYAAGFNSSGRFYASAERILGMAPKRYREGGKGMEIQFALGECSLGTILVATSDKGICAISLGDDAEQLLQAFQEQFANANLTPGDKRFDAWVAKVVAFVEEPGVGLSLPLDIRGTAFQQRVWQALTEIPLGSTISYAELAERIGSPKAVRAVARACASNSLALAIPCHRVVRSDGALSGYRWGVDRKRTLLMRELAQGKAAK
ncbi:bifunctional DNA-binding transcriptional regulator/O6-methylguanine-DNA methyltransferase Ada [Halomonas cupida]|uniref:bifunctional DNA-binding transcriptional regulator/O6-methylguanine-DNA methyltransferase Ada n=1 Tax=Halomonas TaxID=2745 RepID=UPI001A8CA2F2|nr:MULTISPECIES: bifunctional DNA-binding transcriptional regulator/O6-methylguanine-DNA methyltransferase Ada [Halomonas]MBN8412859.1 bifunctional DNA-binding transcriptional regulator/O6-methylguanine-DNA methyltransferase Ada [Halomonas litopenaei]MBY5983575.1 bifunctional DNA-binding transcriptional regulator/O6-methylguanine-DNA methyltransferase Ada [Halomonas sp. DP5Y7-2]MEE3214623.1 bifunctional DNA-binding transcriptional regulator/O6-methylguanine-DNA methyltransferase Ada [Pseudomonad